MSRARAAAAGYRFLVSQNHRVRIRVADVPKGTVLINANPEDEKVVHVLYNPGVLDFVLDKSSRGLVLTSAFTTAFEGLAIAGLVVGKGPPAATEELLDRVLPDTPQKTLTLATQLTNQVKSNLEKTKMISRRCSSGGRPATQRSSGGHPVSSATPATQRNGNGNGSNSNGNNGNGGSSSSFDDINFWGML